MKLLLALIATALLGLGVTACGSTSKASQGSHDAAATATVGSSSPGHYLNDGDNDPLGDGDGDNGQDIDHDAFLDYKTDENGRYHDSDDSDLDIREYGKAASATEEQAIKALITHYYALAAAGNGTAACPLIVASLVNAVPLDYGRLGPAYVRGAKTCAAVMTLMFKHFHSQLVGPVHVTAIRVKGTGALALLGSETLPASQILVRREGGVWKVDALLGATLG